MSNSDTESVASAVAEEEITDIGSAVRRVCKNAVAADGLVRVLHEACKALDAGKVKFAFLSDSCDEPNYKKLVKALCMEKSIPLYAVPDSKKLGEWAGLCKVDSDGNARKVVGASVVVITDEGEASEAINWLQNNAQ